MRALEGVLSSQMIIHVYTEVKTPEETSAMTGSGSVHIYRETQALSDGGNDPRGKHSLRLFRDAFQVVKPCVEANWESPRGRFLLESLSHPSH